MAPEILMKRPYGVKCDVWSAGVLAFVLMGGYQPFHGKNDDEVKNLIVKGDFNFEDKYWNHISDAAKDFIHDLLVVDPDERVEAEDLMSHSWFSEDIVLSNEPEDKKKPVFFMIGSQRSGSNWLRTMLDQREDLVGPHPPHVMREFMPLISKFGDLSQDESFDILVDHVCTFVERNQVLGMTSTASGSSSAGRRFVIRPRRLVSASSFRSKASWIMSCICYPSLIPSWISSLMQMGRSFGCARAWE